MPTFYCPTCGSGPVLLWENLWECGFCGDCGPYSTLPGYFEFKRRERDAQLAVAISDLEKGIVTALEGMRALYKSEERVKYPVWHLAIYGISKSLIPSEHRSDLNLELLRYFFRRYPVCEPKEVLSTALSGTPAFEDVYKLTGAQLGTFWQEVLNEQMPHYDLGVYWPDWLHDIVMGLSQVEAFFSDQDEFELFDNYEEILNDHWSSWFITHPNREELERMVSQWDLLGHDWAIRDLLIAAFPECAADLDPETVSTTEEWELMGDTYEKNPQLGLEMWRFLLDTAHAFLDDAGAARRLTDGIMEFVWQDGEVWPERLTPILDRLEEDELFARQVFQNAHTGETKQVLLQACEALHKYELRSKLLLLMGAT